ncbi:MAG: MBL fold metallo-hydrolase, partial [Breznakia sp.]
MKIIALVENTTKSELKAKHGLSLYIETLNHKILFDLGSDDTLFKNAKKRNIDISKVDVVVISHGHADHGGALDKFLAVNNTAKIYVQRKAFEPYYSKIAFFKIRIGLDASLKKSNQIVLVDGDYKIDDELILLTVSHKKRFYSPANNVLFGKDGKDDFSHEQNLIINEDVSSLIMGCGHSGVVNIMEKAKTYSPTLCVGGYHLFNPMSRKTVSTKLLDEFI